MNSHNTCVWSTSNRVETIDGEESEEEIDIKEKNRRVSVAAKDYVEFFNDLKYMEFMNEVRISFKKLKKLFFAVLHNI